MEDEIVRGKGVIPGNYCAFPVIFRGRISAVMNFFRKFGTVLLQIYYLFMSVCIVEVTVRMMVT